MKHILAIFAVTLLASCAASTNTLIVEANACVATSINDRGIIGQPSDEQHALCWADVNRRMDADERREKERQSRPRCSNGSVAWCDDRFGDKRCSCVSRRGVREAHARTGMPW